MNNRPIAEDDVISLTEGLFVYVVMHACLNEHTIHAKTEQALWR